MIKKVHQINDRTFKYQIFAQTKHMHNYLGLPGKFKATLPQENVSKSLNLTRTDVTYINNEGLIINIEEESDYIREKTLKKISDYVIAISHDNHAQVYQATICHKNPKKEFECYKHSPSIGIKVHYIYFTEDELWQKYENVINKVKQKEKLSEMEALDIAFISRFVSKKHAPYVVTSLSKIYRDAIIEDKILKMDIGVILSGMIMKYIKSSAKQKNLMKLINMKHIMTDLERIVYDEFGEELSKKDEEIEKIYKEIEIKDNQLKTKDNKINKLDNTNKEYKNKIQELNKLENLPKEAKNILNTLIKL